MIIITICDLPFELLLQVAQHLSFSNLWYFSTCSKQTKTLGYELILNKYDINLIRPKIMNPFARLVHSAIAYLERHQQLPTTIQSVANHLTVAINDRIPLDSGMAATLDFLLDQTLSLLINSIFFDIPYLSASELKQITFPSFLDDIQPNQSTSNNNNSNISNNVDNGNDSDNINTSNNDNMNVTSNSNMDNDNNNNDNSDTSNINTNDTILLSSLNNSSVSPADSITSSINTKTTDATFLMADFITTLNEMLSVFYTDIPLKKLLMPHIYRILNQLTNRRRKENQQNIAKYGLRICVLFLCCLFQHDLITGADIVSFARELPHFFTTHPGDSTFIQQYQHQYENGNNNNNQDNNVISPGQTLATLCYDTELRMFILMDLVRVIINKNRASGRSIEPLEIKCLISMLQNSLTAFKSIKVINT
ncbi:unnamed protein product [Cunninghamella echinulata]